MHSTNLREIKAALWEQAFIGCTSVRCPMGRVVQVRRRKGQLLAMIYGWGRWYPVERVDIDVLFIRPAHPPQPGANESERMEAGWSLLPQQPERWAQTRTKGVG